MDEFKEVKIGNFILEENGYADQFWIYRTDREGMALTDKQLEELESLIADFYKKHF